MADLGRPAKIAIGFAVVALLTSLIAVVVVMRRGGGGGVVAAAPVPSKSAAIDSTIDASEVTKLKRDVVEKVTDDKGTAIGVKLKDEGLRATLGLEPGDVITAINGRTLKREFDVYDAVLGMSMMDASIVYVEILRDKQPVLVRWKLEGDLRSARRDPIRRPSVPNPFTAPRDPLVDTIVKVSSFQFEVPRATFQQFLANPDQYARQARIVPSIKNGQPDGFKIYAMQVGSLWLAFGIQNGDTIRTVNGQAPNKIVELKDATKLEVVVGRRTGTEEMLTISIK